LEVVVAFPVAGLEEGEDVDASLKEGSQGISLWLSCFWLQLFKITEKILKFAKKDLD
jgi:hypothetical protein